MYYYSIALLFAIVILGAVLDRIPPLTGKGHRIALWIACGFAFWILAKDAGLIDIVHHALR